MLWNGTVALVLTTVVYIHNCYYITDINNNVISSFYFGEAFKSENADKILKQSEETILNWFIENKWGHCILKVQLKGENL